jgi:hypothetical protein
MDEIEKIHVKNRALIKARDYLLHQTPSDLVAITYLNESIIDLVRSHLEAANTPKMIPEVSKGEQRLLREAIQGLDKNLENKAPASQILSDAKEIYILEPWPRGPVGWTRPW